MAQDNQNMLIKIFMWEVFLMVKGKVKEIIFIVKEHPLLDTGKMIKKQLDR